MNRFNLSVLAAGLAFTMVTPTLAQDAVTIPSQSSESYQDWTVECALVKTPVVKEDTETNADDKKTEDKRVCNAIQYYMNTSGKNRTEVARLVFGYGKKDKDSPETLLTVVRTLVNVSFKATPKFVDGETTLIEGKFRNCLQNYCYFEFDADRKKLGTLETAKKPSLQYTMSNGRTFRINVSPRGLGSALDTLEARRK